MMLLIDTSRIPKYMYVSSSLIYIYSYGCRNQKYFWHGARETGEADTDSYCEAWTSGESSDLGVTSSYTSGQVLDRSLHTCDTKLAVLCIETTVQEAYRQR